MITLSNTAIITPTDVTSAAVEGLAVSLEGKDASGAIKSVCNAVSDLIDVELGRTLHVHAATVYVPLARYKSARNTTYGSELWLEDWPLVESTETVVTTPAKAGGQLVFTDSKHESITGFYGYRRHDQTLVALQAISPLATLTTLPDVLPAAIYDAACAIALHVLNERLSGKFSGESVTQDIGQGSVQITQSNSRVVRQHLNRIMAYKHIA